MKKDFLIGALIVFSVSNGAYAMMIENDTLKDVQPNHQKTEFDKKCEEKFQAEQERLKKVNLRVEKRLGLDKKKKQNLKHLK